MDWLWIPATIIYIPILVLLGRRGRSLTLGPEAKLWNAAWTAMGLMSVVVLIALIMARGRIETAPFLLLWPPMAFALYGGAWALMGLVRRRLSYAVVAAGSFVTAIVCAMLISTPDAMARDRDSEFSCGSRAPGPAIDAASARTAADA